MVDIDDIIASMESAVRGFKDLSKSSNKQQSSQGVPLGSLVRRPVEASDTPSGKQQLLQENSNKSILTVDGISVDTIIIDESILDGPMENDILRHRMDMFLECSNGKSSLFRRYCTDMAEIVEDNTSIYFAQVLDLTKLLAMYIEGDKSSLPVEQWYRDLVADVSNHTLVNQVLDYRYDTKCCTDKFDICIYDNERNGIGLKYRNVDYFILVYGK